MSVNFLQDNEAGLDGQKIGMGGVARAAGIGGAAFGVPGGWRVRRGRSRGQSQMRQDENNNSKYVKNTVFWRLSLGYLEGKTYFMADQSTMTLEQIEAHIKAANLSQYEPKAGVEAVLDLNGLKTKVCGVYKGIRPILAVVVKLPLIPKTIKDALTTFMNVMDQICPS